MSTALVVYLALNVIAFALMKRPDIRAKHRRRQFKVIAGGKR